MNTSVKSLQQWAGTNAGALQGLSAPLLAVAILALMVLPIPPWMLDAFFTLNIAVALMVMMVAERAGGRGLARSAPSARRAGTGAATGSARA